MGTSETPDHGYDKKTMADDIYRLVQHLGLSTVNVAGHDIGSMVAFSLAANHPETVRKLAMLEEPHPNQALYDPDYCPIVVNTPRTAGGSPSIKHPICRSSCWPGAHGIWSTICAAGTYETPPPLMSKPEMSTRAPILDRVRFGLPAPGIEPFRRTSTMTPHTPRCKCRWLRCIFPGIPTCRIAFGIVPSLS
jgi:pimeloyl-ACP methyl ester carboxylesterase